MAPIAACRHFMTLSKVVVSGDSARETIRAGRPVTNFKRSTRLYKLAMSYNRGLDRDKDRVACEKK